jgi:hypothetical protein
MCLKATISVLLSSGYFKNMSRNLAAPSYKVLGLSEGFDSRYMCAEKSAQHEIIHLKFL